MKNKLINVFALAIFFLTATLFAGGQQGDEAAAPAADLDPDVPGWTLDTSPVEFDWYLHFSWFPNQWGVDPLSQYVTEKTGVDINFIVPAGSEAEKLNTLIAGDQLPDFITIGWWEGFVNDMIEGDMVYALDELAEQYDPYFFEVAVPSRLGWYEREDGHVYGYPNASYSPEDYERYDVPANQTFLVRKDMYEALGKPDMRTPEGFIAALEAAKKMFPEVNGQPLIPFGSHEFGDQGSDSFGKFLQDFLAIPYEEADGTMKDRFADPEYKRWLKAFNDANDKGLMSPDIFIDKRAQMEEKIAQGRYFSMLYQRTDFASPQMTLFKNDPDSVYIAVPGPSNSKLDDPTLAAVGISGWTVTLISKNCENPERAIRFMSYWMSEEGQRDFYYGVEGVTWEMVDGKPQFIPEAKEMMDTDRPAFDKQHGANQTFWMLMDNPMFEQWQPAPVEPFKQMIEWTYPYTVSVSQYDNTEPTPDLDEGIVLGKVKNMRGKYIPALVTAKSDAEFEAIWNEWQQKKADLGYDDVLEYQTEKLEINKTKLGL
ncbi:extracellular solute-binding protein [Spirochaeta isovalerica]|uniref:Putative aldouronate transport system substrate-binding protein n=1 Tax=Spirochaeta isovalerica TaxID=150 RepID=A0A841R997_9SPIO|nr:extracellular solute-binding protein [Spirochaeta isovalerica]MBB6479288.1 putative aldouronate transport system substrate-binding protein [Spirochaeta isovalerica]